MDQEIEAKFYVSNLHEIHNRVYCLGAKQIQKRSRLLNDRYDTADGSLNHAHKVLRIRTSSTSQLTYKEGSETPGERTEIEFTISDPTAAHRMLTALGYTRFSQYETFRETFCIGDVQIMLDELPFGTFVEIEGPSMQAVEDMAAQLQLDWGCRIFRGYNKLFLQLKEQCSLTFSEATFENFSTLPSVLPADLGVKPAD
ncbi:MAG: class IV adenylate cyclase [Anaerolineales bacterium]|nr:class IV adenylate cyclase [Anaerolineales bacterium]